MFFDPRDKAWVAISDDLPGCSAGGDTPFEALKEFEIALEIWLAALKAEGKSIPEPDYSTHKKAA
ncbi:MAG: type II toxin-antitoxin system HicB family antitoxin [bacterium]|nr:type II toxin-antitoxin system HicB family antitoxin [bacterium]